MIKKENIYKKIQINTSSPIEIIVMLYKRAIQDIENAKEFYQKDSIKDKTKGDQKIEHANEIITELMASLNFKDSKEIASGLFSIYVYLNKELNKIIIDKNLNKIENVLKHLKSLYNAWKEISNKKIKPSRGINIAR